MRSAHSTVQLDFAELLRDFGTRLAMVEGITPSLQDRVDVWLLRQKSRIRRARSQANRNAEAESLFRLLVESIQQYAIFVLDPAGRVITWNVGAERIKGYTKREILGRHFSVFYPPEVVATGKCARVLEAAARAGRFEEEGWRLRKNGSRFWAQVTITALRSRDGTLIGFVKVTQDLTARRAAEDHQRALAAALAEKVRFHEFQEQFLGILGHDLRTPLAAIEMGSGILRQRTGDPDLLHVIDRMHSSLSRISRMVGQILDMTRSRLAGGFEVNPRPMDLCEVITAVVDELRAEHPTRTIELHCLELQGTWDSDRLAQVFSNLIGNAIFHGEPGSPVTVRACADAEAVRVEVHNQGPPIPDELRTTLFDPFRRGRPDTSPSNPAGLGLGLYISRELVEAHGGSLDFDSSSSHGTTFRVTLPRAAS